MDDKKQTWVSVAPLSNLTIAGLAVSLERHIHSKRLDGWHFASHVSVDIVEDGKTNKYILCTFCR
jgi:hypothetical protein